jgi:predicted porin
MKKSLIALAALSAFATAAQAQSSVTIYGSIDTGYSSTKTDWTDVGGNNDAATTGIAADSAVRKDVKNSGMAAVEDPLTSSRLGLRGTEDLGGGLAAQFNFEFDTSLAGGEALSTSNARTSTVGLTDKSMGTINIGRQLTGAHGTVVGFSPIGGSNMVGDILYSGAFRAHSVSNLNSSFAASGVGATAVGMTAASATTATDARAVTVNSIITSGVDSVRMNRGISYVSPTFSGFTVRGDYAEDKVNADEANTTNGGTSTSVKHQGLTANYAGGPLRVAVSTHTAKADISNAATAAGQAVSELKVDAISAAYQLMPALSLQASYAETEYTTAGAMTSETKAYRLGASYNIGKWVLAAQYGQGDVTTPAADTTLDAALGTATSADREAYQLAAIYNLSKRTNLYAAYGTQEQKITGQVLPTNAAANSIAIGDNIKSTQYAVGVRHSF